jgi:hypothetical protein
VCLNPAHLSFIFAIVNYSINIKKVTIMEEIKNEQSRYEQAWSLYDENKPEEAFKMFYQLAVLTEGLTPCEVRT